MLAEKAHKLRGRYTDPFEQLDSAIGEAEEAHEAEGRDGDPITNSVA